MIFFFRLFLIHWSFLNFLILFNDLFRLFLIHWSFLTFSHALYWSFISCLFSISSRLIWVSVFNFLDQLMCLIGTFLLVRDLVCPTMGFCPLSYRRVMSLISRHPGGFESCRAEINQILVEVSSSLYLSLLFWYSFCFFSISVHFSCFFLFRIMPMFLIAGIVSPKAFWTGCSWTTSVGKPVPTTLGGPPYSPVLER